MIRRSSLAAFLAVTLLAPPSAWAQATSVRDMLVGAWSFVSVVSQSDDGRRGEPFGASPKGIIIFTPDGHFSLFQSTAELPRLAANDRARATPEEAMTVVRDSIAYYGSYTVNEAAREFSLTLVGSTYTNLMGSAPQRRIITTLTPTDLAFSNPRTPSGVTLNTVWRRASPQ
ncbi:lipocalin-like domain-containing protein [Falsiroseomonas oryzae]|uniref:lipocalin-like domain-containing protein n=1 Tax=Falsiroseomonas oryzae TaxID=2766473 RepID=UPI0022EA8AA7|nr:lipocalin-like domain-containing protein [Roseomonas sp. MO-31]